MENTVTHSDSVQKITLSGNEIILALDGRNINIPISVLQTYLGVQAVSGIGGVVPNQEFVPGQGSAEAPAIYFATPGTYSGFGGIELTSPLSVISWNGSAAQAMEVPIPPAENKIKDFVPGETYVGGANPDQKKWKGQVWSVKPEVVSTMEEPGTGTDWIGDIDKVTKSEFNTVSPITEMFTTGKNLINKEELLIGNYDGVTGVQRVTSPNWLSTPKRTIPVDIGQLVLSGHGNVSSSAPRVLFWKADGTFLPDANILGKGPNISDVVLAKGVNGNIPADAAVWAFNLWNSETLGPDPTDNEVANRVMLRDASTSSDYEPFNLLNPDYIKGGIPSKELVNQTVNRVDSIGSFTDILKEGYERYFKFDGTAFYDLPTGIRIEQNGDFIEWVSRFDATSYQDGLGLFGAKGTIGSNVFGYYSEASIYLREDGIDTQPWLDFTGLGINFAQFHKFKLLVSAGNYQLYIDDVKFPTEQPVTNGLLINTIGAAYSNYFKGAIKTVHIHNEPIDEVTPPIDIIIEDLTGENSTNVKEKYKEVEELSDTYPDFFYEVNPTGADGGFPKITFFTKRKGATKTYVGHEIIRFVDTDPVAFVDYYRNAGASNYVYNGESMVRLSTRALLGIENEFTMLQAPYLYPGSKIDHTGGVHGDEKTVTAVFLADGKEIDRTMERSLTPAKSIEYSVFSTLHNAATGTKENPIIDPDHTVIAHHIKNVVFGNGGYRVVNSVTSKVDPSLPIRKMYTGLICNHKDQALFGRNENSLQIDLSWIGTQITELENTITKEFYGSNPNTGLSSYIRAGISYIGEQRRLEHFIQRRELDSKYYLQFPPIQTNPQEPYIELALDDVIIVEAVFECIGGE